jgi:hypothetical protein
MKARVFRSQQKRLSIEQLLRLTLALDSRRLPGEGYVACARRLGLNLAVADWDSLRRFDRDDAEESLVEASEDSTADQHVSLTPDEGSLP